MRSESRKNRRALRALLLVVPLSAAGWLTAYEPADSVTVCGYARVITTGPTVTAPLTACSPTATSCGFGPDTGTVDLNHAVVTVQAFVCVEL
jgi:hypothetical protein